MEGKNIMSIKVAINGFGRIGRIFLKTALEKGANFEVVAVNNGSTLPDTLAYLFKYDSVYGNYPGEVTWEEDGIVIDGHKIKTFTERNPENLPWKEMGVDIVLESTGRMTDRESCEKHLKAGAKKVVISAPGKNEDITVVMGVNEEMYDPAVHNIISNASCTTNCLAPFTKVLDNVFGIEKGFMTTAHSYTNDQQILDHGHKDLRRARAGGLSIIPTTTGAAKAVGKVLPHLNGKLNGTSLRVPTPVVSVVDVSYLIKKATTKEEVNAVLKEASETYMKGIIGYTEDPLVSVDFRGNTNSCIIDGLSTMVLDGNMVKVLAWYDNEWGYSRRAVDLVDYIIEKGL